MMVMTNLLTYLQKIIALFIVSVALGTICHPLLQKQEIKLKQY